MRGGHPQAYGLWAFEGPREDASENLKMASLESPSSNHYVILVADESSSKAPAVHSKKRTAHIRLATLTGAATAVPTHI